MFWKVTTGANKYENIRNQDGLVKKRLLFLRHYSGYWGYKTLNFSTLSQSFGRVKTLKFDFIFRINKIVKIHCWFQSFYYLPNVT